jgi:Asp-tRNA(Asn)/Glu-tRNA(Gln) amidotransferase C subunit
MKRKALLKSGDNFVVLDESRFDAETQLQEALKLNPEVIPVSDLDLAEVVVVGRETVVPVGAIDLLLVDADGRVIIVETKLSSNPDLRRQVVAQVLDYGASLWRMAPTLKQFEDLVLQYWHSDTCQDERVKNAETLRQGIDPIFGEIRGQDWDYDAFETALSENVSSGQHVLLVVASGLTDRLSRDLLQYVNLCLNLPLYAVEIDVFETEGRQLIVPRGVKYSGPTRDDAAKPPTTPEAFLTACTPDAEGFFREMLNEAAAQGMTVYWGKLGFSVRMPLHPPITVMYGFPPDDLQIYTRDWGLTQEARSTFHERLKEKWPFTLSGKYTNRLSISKGTMQQAQEVLQFMWREVDKMMAGAGDDVAPAVDNE